MERDRTILTFGEDSFTESNNFAVNIDLDEDKSEDNHVEIPSSDEPMVEEILADDELVAEEPGVSELPSAEEPVVEEIPSMEEAPSIDESPFVAAPAETDFGRPGRPGKPGKTVKTPKPAREPKYVTRTVFVICLIAAMLVTSVISSTVAVLVSSRTSGTARSKHLSEASQSAATGSDLTVAEIIDKNENSVVEIVTSGFSTGFYGQQQLTEGAGSGVIVKSDGYIVTNYHVINGANKVQVKLHNGESYQAKIVGGDDSHDIAVLKIKAEGLDEVTIADSSKVDVGDLAVAIGNPLGQLGGTATSGIISALDRQLTIDNRTLTLMQTDAAVNAGNSGGGLFDGDGNLIGIVDAKSAGEGIEGLAFAIPINSVKNTIDEIIEKGGKASSKKETASIGIAIQDINEENAQYYNLDGAGVYIGQVTGANAQKAGFQVGDKIVFFEDQEVKDSSDLIAKVRQHKVGDVVTVLVSRNGQQISIKTELEDSETAAGQNN